MLTMLVFWNSAGDVVGTLDYLVAHDERGDVVGLVDFEAHEMAGGRMREIAEQSGAAGSGSWPEWIGARAHDFKVELDSAPGAARARIRTLVHKASGHRRERNLVEDAIVARRLAAVGAADIRDLVGGPGRPLQLDSEGRTEPRFIRTNLPVVGRRSTEKRNGR